MQVVCSECRAMFPVEDGMAGRRVMCRHCHSIVDAPSVAEVAEISEWVDDESPTPTGSDPTERAPCPMCGAGNDVDAEECRACGEPLMPRHHKSSIGVWRDGKLLVMDKHAALPYRCIQTNGSADTLVHRKLSWHHPLIFVVLAVSPLIYIIVALIVRKKAEIDLPVCQRIRDRRRRLFTASWVIGLGAIACLILAIVVGSDQYSANQDLWLLAGIGVLLTGLAAVLVCLQLANLCPPAKITERHVWLKNVHPDYLAALRDWPGERRERSAPRRG